MTKVVLTVAGHSVEVEAEESLAYCEMTAYALWRKTLPAAERGGGLGFSTTNGQYELAPDLPFDPDEPPKRKEERL